MQVKKAIEQLQKYYNADDHIMIGWCESGDLNGDDNLTLEVWEEACARADESEYIFDMEMGRIIVSDVENEQEETLRKKAIEASNKRTEISGEYNTEWKPITKE